MTSVSLPSTPHALGAYYVLASAEASSNLARFDGARYGKSRAEVSSETLPTCLTGSRVDPAPVEEGQTRAPLYSESRSAGFGPEVQKRLLLGTFALSAE